MKDTLGHKAQDRLPIYINSLQTGVFNFSRQQIQIENDKKQKEQPLYLDFLIATYPKTWTLPPHIIKIAETIQDFISGKFDRLLIKMPPRHSKTQSSTIRLAAYMMEMYPEDNVLITSYNERMARRFSRMSRNIYSSRNKMDKNKTAADEWQSEEGGVCMARGTGNAPTGQGFSVLCIDDPVANREQAESKTYRDNVWDWYTSDLLTRLEPGGKVLITMTPWNEDDLSVRAVEAEPDKWHILDLPAICEDADDIIGRSIGEALWPERYNIDDLLRIKKVIGDYAFQSLYQVNPTPKEGSFIKIHNLKYIDALPNNLTKIVRSWDLAATENDGDFSAGIKMGIDADKNIYIIDVVRGQWSPDVRDKWIKNTADLDGRINITIPEDPGAAGKFQAQYLFRVLAGHNINKIKPTGKKEIRAEGVASQINAGNVYILKAPWNREFVEELRTFPLGKHDDQVDAMSDAFSQLFILKKFMAY